MISFVIIEYNSVGEVDNCIRSIRENTIDLNREIIVSSNSCYDKLKQEEIKEKFPGILWLFNEYNGGFSYGMNKGLFTSKGEYIVILNSDVIIKGGLNKLTAFMSTHTDIGAVGPRIVDENGILQDSCRRYLTVQGFLLRHLRRKILRLPVVYEQRFDYSRPQTVDWVIGAFIMIRREVLNAAGGLDEKYVLYAEDMDWCTRIRKAGYYIAYFPASDIVYKGSRSARKNGGMTMIFIKSHVRYWFKYGFFSGYHSGSFRYFD